MERKPRLWLVELRKDKELSQQMLADKAGIARNYLSEIETGIRTPSVDVAQRISEVLNVEWTIFFNYDCRETNQSNSISSA